MRKTLQDLTIKDNFMFAAVMADSENCKELLEMVLEIPIAKIHVHPEKTIIYNPTSKGVRLDIEAEDENHTHYDVEMQVEKKAEKKESTLEFTNVCMIRILQSNAGQKSLVKPWKNFWQVIMSGEKERNTEF